jgi:hypothetical protein
LPTAAAGGDAAAVAGGAFDLGRAFHTLSASRSPTRASGRRAAGQLHQLAGSFFSHARGEELAEEERSGAGAEVDETIDDADGDAGVLAAAEVHRRGAREHAVHADDAEEHEEREPADERRLEEQHMPPSATMAPR